MFCPRCGQQAAEGVSFCSRCGLPLDAAAELVEAGGELARPGAGGGLTPRQRGVRKGLMLTVGGLLSFKAAVLLTLYKEDLFVLLIPAGVFLIVGIMRILYALLLEEHAPPEKKSKRVAAAADSRAELKRPPARGAELPPAQTIPANAYASPGAGTSDMAAPASVTESTTRLLEGEEGNAPRGATNGGRT